jgi:endonuclease YncB( thermonuclease family)
MSAWVQFGPSLAKAIAAIAVCRINRRGEIEMSHARPGIGRVQNVPRGRTRGGTGVGRRYALACSLASLLLQPRASDVGGRVIARETERVYGIVTRVADGDTLDITSGRTVHTVRLDGVDAPEVGQRFSRQARLHLVQSALWQSVTAHVVDRDRYGRSVARVTIGAMDLSEEMVRSGFAWHYARYSPDGRLADLEEQARRQRRGLWADDHPVAPWLYRQRAVRAPPASSAVPSRSGSVPDGPVRGNVSSHVYHAPGCKDYNCRRCTEVFLTGATAEAEGYRPHKACVKRR